MPLDDPVVCHHGTPKDNYFAITPHDTNALAHFTSHIYVGGAGDISVIPVGDTSASPTPVPFVGLTVGWHPIRVTRVWTSTTATNIVAVWR